jgi:hypothetical protein
MDLDDSSIIAVSRKTESCMPISKMKNGHMCSVVDDRTQSPLQMMLHQQQQQIIESAYRSTVPQAPQFTGPISLQRKLDEQAKRAAEKAAEKAESEKPVSPKAPSSTHSAASSETIEAEDPLVDTYTVANSVVQFLEDSLDDQSPEEELCVIQSSLQTDLGRAACGLNSRPRPLYMRGQTSPTTTTSESPISQTSPMTYAGALRKTPALPETPSPEPLHPSHQHRQFNDLPRSTNNIYDPFGVFSQRAQPMMMSPGRSAPLLPPADPLDVLRNLNIKASPSTQALFDYFA